MANGNTRVRTALIKKIAGCGLRIRKGAGDAVQIAGDRNKLEARLARQWEIRRLCIAASKHDPAADAAKSAMRPYHNP